jgi:hypothetical protein
MAVSIALDGMRKTVVGRGGWSVHSCESIYSSNVIAVMPSILE